MIRPLDWNLTADSLNIGMNAFEASVEAGFKREDEAFVEDVRENQLSGRHSDDTGLNRITSNLYDSFHEITEVHEGSIAGSVLSDDGIWEEYGHLHQDGTEKLKKRLFVPERFEAWEERYEAVALDAMGVFAS